MCAPSPKQSADSTGPSVIPHPSPTGEENSTAPVTTPSSEYSSYTGGSTSLPQLDPASTHHLLQMRDYHDYQKNNCLDSDFQSKTKFEKLRDAKRKILSCLRRRLGVIVTGAAFTLFFNVIGWMGCYSVLFVSLQDEFQSSATETGWVGSLAFIINCVCTPLGDFLIRRFSNRAICVVGVLCCFVSLIVSSLMPQLFYLFVTFGLLYGLGSGLVLKSTLDLLLNCFPDICGRVTFIVFTGSTMGVFAWTPITTAFIELWGWRNCLRITGGIMLLFSIPCTFPMGMATPPSHADDSKSSQDPEKSNDAAPDAASEKMNNKIEEIKWEGMKEKRMVCMPEAWLFGLANLAPFISMGFYYVNLASVA